MGVKPTYPISRRDYKITRELSEFTIVLKNNNKHCCQVCHLVPGFHKYPSLQAPQDCIVHLDPKDLTLIRRSNNKERFLRFSIREITTTFYIDRLVHSTPSKAHKQEAIEAQQTEYTTTTISDEEEALRASIKKKNKASSPPRKNPTRTAAQKAAQKKNRQKNPNNNTNQK